MSFMVKPLIATYEASVVPIAKGVAVKLDASQGGKRVRPCTATTDKAIGIAQNLVSNVGDLAEVALSGGGAKALAKATIAAGDILGVNADGSIQKVASAADRVVGHSMDDAVAGDIFSMHVVVSQAQGTQS